MSIGAITDEASLERWLQKRLETPGTLAPPKADVSLVKEGVPDDTDFPNPPGDRTLAYDREGETLYIRDEDEWKPL